MIGLIACDLADIRAALAFMLRSLARKLVHGRQWL